MLPMVHPDAQVPRTVAGRARELRWHRLHAGAARELDQRAERRLVRQPAALLRRAVSSLVSRCSPTATRTRGRWFRQAQLPIDPSTDVPDGYRADPARTARRLQWRPRHHGHVGDLVAVAADRRRLAGGSGSVRSRLPHGRATAGRHHPHLAVFDRASLGLSSASCRGATPRSPAGFSIPTARKCRSRRATSSRRWACSKARRRRRALLGRERYSGNRHRVRHGADEGRCAGWRSSC